MKINIENNIKGIFMVLFCISIFLFAHSNGYNILPFDSNIILYLYSMVGSIAFLLPMLKYGMSHKLPQEVVQGLHQKKTVHKEDS